MAKNCVAPPQRPRNGRREKERGEGGVTGLGTLALNTHSAVLLVAIKWSQEQEGRQAARLPYRCTMRANRAFC